MTADRYQANIITKNPTDPTSSLETGAAPGVWSISEAEKYRKAGVWPTAGTQAIDVNEVFSTYLYDGNSTNQTVDNGINLGQSYGSGGGDFNYDNTSSNGSGTLSIPSSTDFGFGTGDFTIEMFVFPKVTQQYCAFFSTMEISSGSNPPASNTGVMLGCYSNGALNYDFNSASGGSDKGTTLSNGVWSHVALTRSGSSVTLWVNGTSVSTASNSDNLGSSQRGVIGKFYANYDGFGFKGYLSNVRVVKGTALYTSNFTAPTSELTAVSGTVLLTLQGSAPFTDNSSSAHSLTADSLVKETTFGPFDAATAGDGGMVWFKQRNGTYNHVVFDTERWTSGNGGGLFTNAANGAGNINEVTSFNSAGFSVTGSGYINDGSSQMASWAFKKQARFFDIQTWAGNEVVGRQISHNLGTTPGCIIVKRTSGTRQWAVYHRSQGATKYAILNDTAAFATSSAHWNDTEPTSTHFTVGDSGDTNTAGHDYVAYIFAHNDGDGGFGPSSDADIIKCGTYSGTGALQEIDLGFEAQWVLLKRADSAQDWAVFDQMRGLVANPVTGSTPTSDQDARIRPNEAVAEQVDTFGIDPSPNGFAVRGNNVSVSGSTYVYVAIRRGPLTPPTSGSEVFHPTSYIGNDGSNQVYSDFPVDLEIVGPQNVSRSWKFGTNTRTIGRTRYVATASNSTEATDGPNPTGGMFGSNVSTIRDGTQMNASADSPLISWKWRRAPKYLDIVTHDGTGGAITLNHNLTIAPEMIWTKSRTNSENWQVWHKDVTGNLELDNTSAANTGSIRVDQVTATSFRYTGFNTSNGSGQTYVSYIFGTLEGVSKVGSFSHTNGTATNVDCGFTSGARFVLLKRYNDTGSWVVFDTARGITTGNDPYAALDSTAADVTSNDVLAPYSAGFTVTSSFLATGDWLFYAVA